MWTYDIQAALSVWPWQAIRLFDRDNGIITAAAWRRALPTLVGVDLKDEESMALFNKYDQDGGGEIDTYEFIENVPNPLFCISLSVCPTRTSMSLCFSSCMLPGATTRLRKAPGDAARRKRACA